MIFEVDGNAVSLGRVSHRTFGFGEPAPGFVTRRYRVRIPVDELIQLFGAWYAGYAEDDRKFSDGDAIQVDLDLRAKGWPALDRLARDYPQLLSRFLMQYPSAVIEEIMRPFWRGSTEEFVINGLRAVSVERGDVVLEGEVIAEPRGPTDRACANPRCSRRGQPVTDGKTFCTECGDRLS